jgi:integrase
MARLPSGSYPTLRRHKARSQAVVTLSGHDHYLGAWPDHLKQPPPDIRAEYDRLIALWVANGRRPLNPSADGPTVAEVVVAFLAWAGGHYRHPDGAPTPEVDNFRFALRLLVRLFADEPAVSFGPLALKAVRRAMVEAGLARTQVNARVGKIKRVFKWAASEELVPVAVYQALATVPGLQKGRCQAKEREPVAPVTPGHIEAVLPFLTPTVRAMVLLQRLTGMRPGEVMAMRPGDIDRAGAVWYYRPSRHKTAYRGRGRVVVIGPQAQALLAPFLLAAGPDGYAFSPRRSMAAFRASQRSARRSGVQPSQVARSKARPRRAPGDRYTRWSYAEAVARACVAAAVTDLAERWPDLLPPVAEAGRLRKEVESALRKAGPEERPALLARVREAGKTYRAAVQLAAREGGSVEHWHPNQLRHLHGTEVRRRFGLEAAQVALGHSRADVTQVYAERDLALAERVAREVG